MDSEAICYLSIRELATQFRAGKLTSVEVTRCVLDRVRTMNLRLHAYLTVLEEAALRSATQADLEFVQGVGVDRCTGCRSRSRIFASRKAF